jgi:hypothetical protein
VQFFNPRGIDRNTSLDFAAFDVVVIHYSLIIISDQYVTPWFRDQIAAFRGLKVQFLQDEYRWVDAITDEMRRLGIDVLYSVVPPDVVEEVYGVRLPDTEILHTLTGYVPDRLIGRRHPPLHARTLDVAYRGRSLPYWLGRLGFEKVEIGRQFRERSAPYGLRSDIEWTEGARIYGRRWNQFIESTRTMLASESGSSIVDFDGGAERAVRGCLAARPTATFEEVEATVLQPWLSGPAISTASPRIFEAAASRTAMVMFRGAYDGIVRPWEHYVPLEKDFSNLDEVVDAIRDDAVLTRLIDQSHEELIRSGRYAASSFVARFDQELAARASGSGHRRRTPRVKLQLEQLRTGSGYRMSAFYGLARLLLLTGLGTRETLRHKHLRRLALRANRLGNRSSAAAVRDDLFRLALLTSFQRGDVTPAAQPFALQARLDDHGAQLTLVSVSPSESGAPSPALLSAVADGLRSGVIRRIVWNHSTLDQYVVLKLPFVDRRIGFDVGRHDAYGVYTFHRLADMARSSPDMVANALAPLLVPTPRPAEYRSDASPQDMEQET